MLQDIQFAARVLIKWRWMTAVAVLALALGIAANSAVFTFVNAVLLRGVPFPNPTRSSHRYAGCARPAIRRVVLRLPRYTGGGEKLF